MPDPLPSPRVPPGRPAPPGQQYLKSPSRYLPTACRTMVTTAMTGFTTQNCSVAWERGRGVRAGRSPRALWGVGAASPRTCLQKRRKPME